ncbi:MAG TPA: GntR family transcriptional regulator [Solirubrobacteraceae bacterium]|jgi:DNA-binding transcriptional regulator YhcF (GntR family)
MSSLEDLVLDRDAEVPLGVQLAWALRARIGDGRFVPGERLPGLRDLAVALHINANTVRAVYQRLEHEGVLVSRQGSGTFVADAPAQTSSAVDTIAANAAREARDTGVDPRAVAAALYVAPVAASAAAGHRPDALAARRHQLRTQIAALQRTLGELEVRYPALVPKPAAGRVAATARPRLLDVAELERVQAQLIARLAALHAAVDALAAGDSVSGGSDAGGQAPAESAASRKGARVRAPKATAGAGAGKTKASAKARPAPAGA